MPGARLNSLPMYAPPSFPAFYRRHAPRVWALLAALPVLYIAAQIAFTSRNIVFQDEFDTALALLLRLHEGAGWPDLWDRLFALSNEHRTVTSRVLFAASYWITGTVNFHVVGAIGNAFIFGACALLIAAAGNRERRVRLGVVLAFLVFQLENFENFFWSGASIDHFQIVLLAVGAFFALARGTRGGVALAALLATAATFTLAHGVVVWAVGAGMLAAQRRPGPVLVWLAAAGLAQALFFQGFAFNPGHRLDGLDLSDAGHIGLYWLTMLGAPPAFGPGPLAPWLGVALLAGFAWKIARGALQRDPVLVATAAFAVVSLGLIAYGRAETSGGQIASRYLVLATLAWAVLVFLLIDRASRPASPYRLLVCCLPLLAAFNLVANIRFLPRAEDFVEARDRAALRYKQYGIDGRGQTRLHPQDGHAEKLLGKAQEKGIYRIPPLCPDVSLPDVRPSGRMVVHVDELMTTDLAVSLGGWAMIPGETSARGEVHVVIRSARSERILRAITVQRVDVAKAYDEPRWRLAGFRCVVSRRRLPVDDYQVGLLIVKHGRGEYVMTDNWVRLANPDPNTPPRFNTL